MGALIRDLVLTLLICLNIHLRIAHCQQVQCREVCSSTASNSDWVPALQALDTGTRFVTLRWREDIIGNQYVIEFRTTSTQTLFNMTEVPTGVVEYTLAGLNPSMNYDVRVCRAMQNPSRMDNCGSCLLCVRTSNLDEPPSAPRTIMVTPLGPEILEIMWDEPDLTNGQLNSYTVECSTAAGAVVAQETIMDIMRRRSTISNLSPNTTYTCSVRANNTFGASAPASAQVSTLPRTTTPGALLIFRGGVVNYAHITEDTITFGDLNTFEVQAPELFNTTDTILGVDYHYYREELYLTTNDSQGMKAVKRLQMRVTTNTEGRLTLVAQGSLNTVVQVDSSVELGHITVDWVNDEVFYVESSPGGPDRVMRFVIGENRPPYCVVELSRILTIAVDPVHGFFYWNSNTVLYRTSISSVRVNRTSCLNQFPGNETIITASMLMGFTIEPDEAIHYHSMFDCSGTQISAVLSTNLDGLGNTIYRSSFTGRLDVRQIDSYTERIIITSPIGGLVFIPTAETVNCPDPVTPNQYSQVVPDLIRMFRSSKQPLPVPPFPPSSVKITTSSTTATVSWMAPQLIGGLYSADGFDDWMYSVQYCPLQESCTVGNTTSLSLTISDLRPDTSYRVTVSAVGLGGEKTTPEVVFKTKATDFGMSWLIVAFESNVQRFTLGGEQAVIIEGQTSESNAVAHDYHTDTYYWSIQGGQASIYASGDPSPIYRVRDEPFALEYDWLGRRLFWVEDGLVPQDPLRAVIGCLENPTADPTVFSEVIGAQSTTLDSRNGVFFWTDRSKIMMRTLSGLDMGVCHTPPGKASSLAVDEERRHLFWLSGTETGQTLTISQMEYNATSCNTNSIAAQEIREITFSSSSTVLAYGSNTLFISSRVSSRGSVNPSNIYTISSDLSAVQSGQTLAVGRISLRNTAEIRDITVSSPLLQRLPSGITAPMRSLDLLRPEAPSSPPRHMESASTTSEIVIEWGSSPPLASIPDSPLFYRVDYSLERPSGGDVINGSVTSETNSVTLTGQVALTLVRVTVTTFSLWTRSLESVTGSFTSLPNRPARVNNARVFVYRPNTDVNVFTGLVFWDPVEFAINYTIRVFDQTGSELQNLHRPFDSLTSYIILANPSSPEVNYPLMNGRSYTVQVFATNRAGDGDPSAMTSFTVNEPDYPQQVLSLGAGGSQIVGEMLEINQNFTNSIPEPVPIVVDTIGRTVYWYVRSVNLIYSRSLQSGPQEIFLTIPGDKLILSLAYDWIGQFLYMMRMDTNSRRLEIQRVSIFDTDFQVNVFPNLQEDVPVDSTVQLIMNPFTGRLYWTLSNTATSIRQLNLRMSESVSSSALFSQTVRKRRRRRQTLSSISSITSALAQDPMTGDLFVSDSSSGDILRCQPLNGMCNVVVDASMLGLNPGLPATSIAVNEQRLYWSRRGSPGIYAVNLTNPNSLIMISSTIMSSSIVTLSPGQQILPSNFSCLSSVITDRFSRPVSGFREEDRTNTSLRFGWEIRDDISRCSDVYSIPAYDFRIRAEVKMVYQPELEARTRLRHHTWKNLTPHTTYGITVGASNVYTMNRLIFGGPLRIQTLGGVPDEPTGFMYNASGTASASFSWDVPSEEQVKGNYTVYFVRLSNGERMVNESSLVLTNSSLFRRGETQDIEIIIFNGELNSSSLVRSVSLWPLPPPPVMNSSLITNSSFVVDIILPNDTFLPIRNIAAKACDSSIMSSTMSGNECSCPDVPMTEMDFIPVTLPFRMAYDFGNLSAFTNFCVQAIGNYTTEVTDGIGRLVATASGVPGAPMLDLKGSLLNWTVPSDKGERITRYIVTFRISDSNSELHPTLQESSDTTLNIDGVMNLRADTPYDVVVNAENMNGNGSNSNTATYRTPEAPVVLTVPQIAGIAVGGAALITIIAIIWIILCFLTCCRTSKRELRSLSYMYGPDHELSNLRDAYRHNQSNNPHYTWSREDYVCTDEDLNLLSKFPRNNLKLENFIDRGEFGEVFQGTAMDILGQGTGPTPVAVKTLRKGALLDEQRKFLSEAALMANFNHPNIVKVLGVCVDNDPVYIIMELMPGGDLLKFLREAKMDHGPTLLTLPEQIQVAVDVANGCHYLEQQHFIHRDIAARNCLVSSRGADRVVKIGDFGLAKDLYSSDYYQVEGQRKLPVRWMAPEALLQGKFTVESDIWSFGVLLWEIMTLGNQPYPGRINQEVLQFVTGGGRLDRPDKCPSKIYHLMQGCWKRYSSDRPHFGQILSTLNSYLDRLKRPDSVYYSDSESEEEGENNVQRQGSSKLPSRTPSIREGITNLVRSSSIKLRNSFRRHNSLHKREEHGTNSQNEDDKFRERGPF